jgi:hypothetical protein
VANKSHFVIGIYAPDSVINYTYQATLSGGLCKGHEFQLNIGQGILAALRQGCAAICDSIIMLSSVTDVSALSSDQIKYIITPEIQHIIANADFSNAAFSVKIDAKVEQDINLHVRYMSGVAIPAESLHITSESNGKGEDCHDAVPYLKKAGESAMQNLRDSIINHLLHL